jgi:N-acetyl sugar amidotransferase
MSLYNELLLQQDAAANGGRTYQQCSFSVMDTIADPNVSFDENGISNYYYEYLEAEKKHTLKGEAATQKIQEWVEVLKKAGAGKPYDCMLGVSGGVDSTYLALCAKRLGLRVLCVHFDNGWNSELAVQNIENIVSKCGFDLYTYVINWPEFKDIQLAYFKANVIDIEAVTDVAIFACLDKICAEHKLKYILDGRNVWTEETLPKAWINKDSGNLRNIHQAFGIIPLKSYPLQSRRQRLAQQLKKSYTSVPLLNYMVYDKAKAKQDIIQELGWRDYGGKHYESVFTRFYQGYILPEKFKVDKRKAHLSNLIFAGQMTKAEATAELQKPIYPPEQLAEDKPFVLKKLGFTEAEFDAYLAAPAVPHSHYGSTKALTEEYPILKLFRPIKDLLTR